MNECPKMECERVFNAARDGKLYGLKVLLDHKSECEVALLLSSYTKGATPLLIACRNGHSDVALYLIENCHADVEQACSVRFDNKLIEGASPLWCASAAGHLNVVKVLIQYNASVNSTTKTNSTPLNSACFHGYFEIVKYLIEHGADIEIASSHTCLMTACYRGHNDIARYLVQCGADVNRKNFHGDTALHGSAASGRLCITIFLLLHGAKFDHDFDGITPLMLAAIHGHEHIVEHYIQNIECEKEEKVNALELLGAALIGKRQTYLVALNYWKEAMDLRHENYKCLLVKPTTRSSFGSYIDADEVHTFAQIEDLKADLEKMKIQAILVSERILGPYDSDTIYYIRSAGATYANNGNTDMCIKLWMYALDVQQAVLKPLSEATQNSLLGFLDLFRSPRRHPVTFQNVLHVFERALTEIKTVMDLPEEESKGLKDTSTFHSLLVIAMHLIGRMCKFQSNLNNSENLKLKEVVYKLIHMNPISQNGFTPLHLVCCENSVSLGPYRLLSNPSSEVVDLLLEVGACPNAVDADNNTPLHISAMNKRCAEATFKLLLRNGAHLDLCNNKRQTPLSLIEDSYMLDICPLQYTNLQCLSSQAVRTHNISYKGFVPKNVETFLDRH